MAVPIERRIDGKFIITMRLGHGVPRGARQGDTFTFAGYRYCISECDSLYDGQLRYIAIAYIL